MSGKNEAIKLKDVGRVDGKRQSGEIQRDRNNDLAVCRKLREIYKTENVKEYKVCSEASKLQKKKKEKARGLARMKKRWKKKR